MIYIVFDDDSRIYGVYEEAVDAEDRKAELDDAESDAIFSRYLIEECPLNQDITPE